MKWQLTEADAAVPLALFAGVSLPTGSRAFTSDSVDPTVGLFWSYTSTLSWFGTAALSELGDATTLSNGVGISLPINSRTGSFVEYVAEFPEGDGSSHALNGGLTFTPRADLQWDISVSFGLGNRAPDFSVGAGIGYRF